MSGLPRCSSALHAELAHPGPVAERPQARRALAAEPAVAAQFFRLLRHARPQPVRMARISSLTSAGRGRLGGRTSARHRPSWASASLTTLTLSALASASAKLLEPACFFPDLHRGAEVVAAQRVEHGQRQGGGDVGQARGEPVRAARPVGGRGQLGRAGQPGEPVDPGVPGHGGERAGVADAVLDADDVRRPVGERGDVRAGDALVPDVQHDAEVGDRAGDGGVVVDPAFPGHVGVHRLVDHDHAGAVVPGVPGRLDRGGDVVADPGQQLGLACLLAAAAVSITCLASAWLSA